MNSNSISYFDKLPNEMIAEISKFLNWNSRGISIYVILNNRIKEIIYKSPLYLIANTINAIKIGHQIDFNSLDKSSISPNIYFNHSYIQLIKRIDKNLLVFQQILLVGINNKIISKYLIRLTSYLNWHPQVITQISQNLKLRKYSTTVLSLEVLIENIQNSTEEDLKKFKVLLNLKTAIVYSKKSLNTNFYLEYLTSKFIKISQWDSIKYKSLLITLIELNIFKDFSKLNLSTELKNDKDLIIKIASVNDNVLIDLNIKTDNLKDDFVLELVSVNGKLLEFFPTFSNNFIFVLKAALQNPAALNYAHECQKSNKMLFKIIFENKLSESKIYFSFMSDNLKNDITFIKEILPFFPQAISMAGENLKNNEQLILLALTHNSNVFFNLSDENKIIFFEKFALKQNKIGLFYRHAPFQIQNNFEYAMRYLQEGGSLKNIPNELRDNEILVLKAFDNEDLIEEGSIMQIAGNNCRNNALIMERAIKNKARAILSASEHLLKAHPKLIWEAAAKDPSILKKMYDFINE